MTDRHGILDYAKETYGTDPDYPWAKYRDYAVLRHAGNKKWYCLVMCIQRKKIGLDGDGDIDIMNLKCRPEWIGSLRQSQGFLPAYHMNKTHWLTVVLDGTVPDADLFHLLDDSFALTA